MTSITNNNYNDILCSNNFNEIISMYKFNCNAINANADCDRDFGI